MRRWGIAGGIASGLAALALSAAAHAAGAPPASPPAAAPPETAAVPQRNGAPILFSADEVRTDEQLGLIIARGHVQISEGMRTLLADVVTYNQKTDTVTASGHVSLLEPTGEIVFADYMELNNRFENGFVKDIRVLLSDRSRLAGNTARRLAGERTEIRRGVYSPCDLCAADPSKPPLWQIRAEKIIHDKETQTIEYRDATLEIDGIPVLWTPYLAHADPTVKRRSGLLPPSFGLGANLGEHFSLPYYWAISPDRDATFTPIFTTGAGQVAAGQYRQRFSNGELDVSGSVNNGERPEDPSQGMIRGHIFANGRWDLDPTWRVGFNVERSSDQTYLQRFHFSNETNFLTSRAFAEAFGPRSFLGIDAYSFQPLRQGVGDSGQPIILPVANYSWVGDPDIYGGRLHFNADVLNLNRSRGVGSHRLSLGTGWERPFRDGIGGVWTVSLTARGDGYYSTDLQLQPGERAKDVATGRIFPQAGVVWRYPLVRRGDSYTQLIEPIAAVFAAPRGGNPPTIPDEDSAAFDFDDTDLFVANRFPGLDRVDGGQRVDYGLRAAIFGDHGGRSSLLVGQSRSLQNESGFLPDSGLEGRLSDIVGRVTVAPSGYFDATYRFRLDKENFRPERQEVSFGGGPENLRFYASYAKLPPDFLSNDTNNRQQLSVGVTAGLSRYWTLSMSTTRNLTSDPGTVSSAVTATYQDECLAFVTSLQQSGTSNRDVRPGVSLVFSVVFKGLGEISAPAFATGGVQ